MRCNNTTTVNVLINDRSDRKNVVATQVTNLRRRRLCLRGACKSLAKQYGEAIWQLQAMFAASAGSPSLGGHSPSGGPGIAHCS